MIYRVNQWLCSRCKRIEKHCDYDFSEMKVVGTYGDNISLVKCTEYEPRLRRGATQIIFTKRTED